MDIKSAEQSFRDITFGDDTYENLLNHLQTKLKNEPYHLCLFIGKRDNRKEKALNTIAERTSREIKAVDGNDIISKIESRTYKSIDRVFANFNSENTLLYLNNGTRLCGSYTGYTQSSVKYATPQERYFLRKVQEHGGLFVIDIAVADDVDNTLRRAAHSIVNFPPPQSGLKKLLWRFKKVGVHGHQIKAERPEHYQTQNANF